MSASIPADRRVWVRGNAYYITSGPYTICKNAGKYLLNRGHSNGLVMAEFLGVFDTAEQAKEACDA